MFVSILPKFFICNLFTVGVLQSHWFLYLNLVSSTLITFTDWLQELLQHFFLPSFVHRHLFYLQITAVLCLLFQSVCYVFPHLPVVARYDSQRYVEMELQRQHHLDWDLNGKALSFSCHVACRML